MNESNVSGLQTIDEGKVPETRMANARATQDVVRRLIKADEKRSRKRAMVDGLVDGNAPYSWRKLREAGRGDACNVNWGTARSYMESGSGAFYDLSSQAPGFVQIATSHGTSEKQAEYGRIMSEEADRLFGEDEDFDNDIQLSQNEMVLHGTGPLFFEDPFKVFPMAIESGDLFVPERTRSKVSRWEMCAIAWDYYPPELYGFIENEEGAIRAGWDIKTTRTSIERAMSLKKQDGMTVPWEQHQQELKANSMTYFDDTNIVRVAHVFWKEFSGRITHGIVERSTTQEAQEYLFLHPERYASMSEAINPMYSDRGRGGYHHNVTGLGVKQFGPMEYENRLLSSLMDKAFAPKTLLQAPQGEAMQKIQMARFGDYAVLSPGVQAVQNPIQGFLQDGLAMFRTSSELMRSNLSSYRQPVEMQKSGNPVTKYEKQLQASQAGSLSNTTFNRYYKQLDALHREIVRRMFNINSTDDRAKLVQERCVERGVPRECFGRILSVKAVRVIGEGTPFMRQQVTAELANIITQCSEDGQNNWRNDFIASRAGQAAVERYNPKPSASKLASDQVKDATYQLGLMRMRMAPVVTASQDAMTFAGVFLKACTDAIGSLEQGADPMEILTFLELCGPATRAHIERMAQDVFRKPIVEALLQRWKQVATFTDKLQIKIKKQQQEKQGTQQAAQEEQTASQIKQAKAQTDMMLKTQKAKQEMQLRQEKHEQEMALHDAKSAHEINRTAEQTHSQIAQSEATTRANIVHATAETASKLKNEQAKRAAAATSE